MKPNPKRTAKKKLNILFTCVGRRVALLECFRRSLGELGVAGRLIGTDITDTSPAFHKVDESHLVTRVDEADYIPSLLRIAEAREAGLLVPLTDLDLTLLAEHRQAFSQIGCTVMIGSPQAVATCQNKAMTNAFFGRIGLRTIRTCTLEEFRRDPFYPCFIKPPRGSAGFGAAINQNPAGLEVHVANFGRSMIVQELVPGQEFTIDVYRSRDGVVRCAVPRQRLAVRTGEVEKGVTVLDAGLMEGARKLAEHLDVWGVFCCQCRRSPGEDSPRFFEINPRFGGGAPLAIAAGANLPLYLLQEVLGLPISAKFGEFTDHLMMLRYDDAVFTRVNDLNRLPGYDTPIFR